MHGIIQKSPSSGTVFSQSPPEKVLGMGLRVVEKIFSNLFRFFHIHVLVQYSTHNALTFMNTTVIAYGQKISQNCKILLVLKYAIP